MRIFILLVILTFLSSVITAKKYKHKKHKHPHVCKGAKLGTCTAIQTMVCYQCLPAGMPIYVTTIIIPGVSQQQPTQHVQECKCQAVQEAFLESQIQIFHSTLQREENKGKEKNPYMICVVIRMIHKLISIKFSPQLVQQIIDACVRVVVNNPDLIRWIKVILEIYHKAVAKKIPSTLFELLVLTISTETEEGVALTIKLIEKLVMGEQNSNSFLPILKLGKQIIKLKILYIIKLIAMICTINGYDEYTKNVMLVFMHQIDLTPTPSGNIMGMPLLSVGIKVLDEVRKTTFNNTISLASVSTIYGLGGTSKLLRSLINAVATVEELNMSLKFIIKHITHPHIDKIFIVLKNLVIIKDNEQVRHIFDLIYWRNDIDKTGKKLKQLLVLLKSVLKCGEKSRDPSDIFSIVVELLLKGGKTATINNLLLIVTKTTKSCNVSFDKLLVELKPQIVTAFSSRLNQIVLKLLIMVFGNGDMTLMPDLGPPKESKPPVEKPTPPAVVTEPPPPPPPPKALEPIIVNPVTIPPDVVTTMKSITVCPCGDVPLPHDIQELMGELNGLEVAICVENQCTDCFRGACSICMNPACKKCALENCRDEYGEIIIKETDPAPCWMQTTSRKFHSGQKPREDMGNTCRKKYFKWLKDQRSKKKS